MIFSLHVLAGRRQAGELPCPVCDSSVRSEELEPHLISEVEQLMCISRIRRQQQMREELVATCSPGTDSANVAAKKDGSVELSQSSRWEVCLYD